MTRASNLSTALDNLASKIATESATLRPSYSIDGQSVSRDAFLKNLIDQYERLLQLSQLTSGPFEVETTGST
jgi:hypothetical protein